MTSTSCTNNNKSEAVEALIKCDAYHYAGNHGHGSSPRVETTNQVTFEIGEAAAENLNRAGNVEISRFGDVRFFFKFDKKIETTGHDYPLDDDIDVEKRFYSAWTSTVTLKHEGQGHDHVYLEVNPAGQPLGRKVLDVIASAGFEEAPQFAGKESRFSVKGEAGQQKKGPVHKHMLSLTKNDLLRALKQNGNLLTLKITLRVMAVGYGQNVSPMTLTPTSPFLPPFEELVPSGAIVKVHADSTHLGSDFLLIGTDGGKVPATKAVLAAGSPVFKDMLAMKNSIEAQEGRARNGSHDSGELKAFWSFLVASELTPEVTGSPSMLLALLDLSEFYQVDSLKAEVAEHLAKHLTMENFQSILRAAERVRSDRLRDVALDFIKRSVKAKRFSAANLTDYPEDIRDLIFDYLTNQ